MSIDLSQVTGLTVQISALSASRDAATDPTVKAILASQVSALQAQLTAMVQHMQSQADASNNLLNGLGLFATLQSIVGGVAPTIVNLFKP